MTYLNRKWGITILDAELHLVNIIFGLISWGILFYLARKIYRKQPVKPAIWKLIAVILLGMFSFSFNLYELSATMRISILPLGVWLFYWICINNKARWEKYRKFAWLGFLGNYIILVGALLAIVIQSWIYPVHKSATVLADVTDAVIIPTHPSAATMQLNAAALQEQLHLMEQAEIWSDEWYMDTWASASSQEVVMERFPYMLTGSKASWGSGISAIIYVEQDGKGLLVTVNDEQFYYRFDHPITEVSE